MDLRLKYKLVAFCETKKKWNEIETRPKTMIFLWDKKIHSRIDIGPKVKVFYNTK